MITRLLTPTGLYRAARDQFGSVRGVYLAGNRIERRETFTSPELVLLLHGFFQTRNLWEVMEDRLRYDGFGVISFNLGGYSTPWNLRPVDRVAEYISEKIESLALRHGFEALHLIGHSKGGLIARRYVQAFGGDARVKSVTTLGTPHHGTPTAVVGVGLTGLLGTSARDMLPGSRLVNALKEQPWPENIPLTSIFSRADLVCPHWASRLTSRPGTQNVEVRDLGHSELAWDPGVYRVVRERLEAAAVHWRQRRAGAAPLAQ